MKNNINKNIIKEITNLIIDYFKKNKMLILFVIILLMLILFVIILLFLSKTNVGDINIITIINY